MNGKFTVLAGFQAAVASTRATLGGGRPVLLAEALGEVVTWLAELERTRGKVILVGNGGSAAIAGHQAVDLWRNAGVRALSFNEASLLTCVANDFGYPEVFARPIAMFAEPGDLLIAVSSSGASANILRAVTAAREKSCRVLTLSGFETDNPLGRAGDLNLYVPSRSYGVVECAHLLLIHACVDELIRTQKERETIHGRGIARNSESALFQSAPSSVD